MHVITITSKFMMLSRVPRKSHLEFGFTKFSDKHCPKCKKGTKTKRKALMRGVYRFNIVWNVTIDWISVSAEKFSAGIRLSHKNFGGGAFHDIKFRCGGGGAGV